MSEFVENPSVLTKDKLKSALLANNVALPNGDQRKDVYVQLYLKNLTALNKKNPSPDAFSSDEELPTPVVSNKSRSGRKATKKTDKPRPEDVDVAELTDQELTEKLQQYGVPSGPIVASTRKVYEKKLQKLLDQGPPETATLSDEPLKADGNQNGNTDSDQYSDKEEETPVPEPEPEPVPEPEPEPAPVVERPLRSRGKTPVTTRTRSSQHNKDDDEDEDEDEPVFNVKRWRRRSTRWREQNDSSECYTPKLAPSRSPGMPPDNQPMLADDVCEGISTITELKPLEHSKPFSARSHPAETSPQEVTPAEQTGVLPQVPEDNAGFSVSLTKTLNHHHHHNLDSLLNTAVLEVPQVAASSASSALSALETLSTKSPKHAPLVEKVSAKESTYVEEKDVLKELFPNEVGTPTGISATCRRPIRGAAGRPVSDVWLDESRLRLTELRESSYIESRSVSRVGAAVPLSSSVRPTAAAPPSGQTQPRRKLPVWVKLLLLGAVAGFGFFVYQAMETNELNPFYMISSSSGSSSSAGESTSK